jgi:hypothetical protein
MAKWMMGVTWKGRIEVEAENEDQAILAAGEQMTPGDFDEFDAEVIDGPEDEEE